MKTLYTYINTSKTKVQNHKISESHASTLWHVSEHKCKIEVQVKNKNQKVSNKRSACADHPKLSLVAPWIYQALKR